MGQDLTRPLPRREVKNFNYSRIRLERRAIEGDGPVGEMIETSWILLPSTAGHVEPRGKLEGPSSKAKHYLATDSELVP